MAAYAYSISQTFRHYRNATITFRKPFHKTSPKNASTWSAIRMTWERHIRKKGRSLQRSMKLIMVLGLRKTERGSLRFLTIWQAKWWANLVDKPKSRVWSLNQNCSLQKDKTASVEDLFGLTNLISQKYFLFHGFKH